MNNLKKIGLSALAGSLASVSAHAAEVSVSGSASITMDRVNKHLVTGNDFSMGDSLGFNMSGETDGGLGVAVYYEIDGGALDDYDMTLSGDWGSLKFNGSGSSSAFGAVDDVMPNAYEESWDILDTDGAGTSGSPMVIGGGGGANMFIYTSPSVMGATLTVAYQNGGGSAAADSYTDYAIAYSPEMVEGLTIGAAVSDNEVAAGGKNANKTTGYVKYAVGGLTVGYQMSEIDNASSSADEETTAYSASMAVNEDLSISVGRHSVDMGPGTTEEVSTGVSASYVVGSTTIGFVANSTEDVAGSAGDDDSYREVSLAFAF